MIVITTIDTLPDHCYECPCHDGESSYCQADKEQRYSDYRPYWCPLKDVKMRESGSMVCLPDVEMPKNCHECNALGISDVVGLKCPCEMNSGLYSYDNRPDECPLKELK